MLIIIFWKFVILDNSDLASPSQNIKHPALIVWTFLSYIVINSELYL